MKSAIVASLLLGIVLGAVVTALAFVSFRPTPVTLPSPYYLDDDVHFYSSDEVQFFSAEDDNAQAYYLQDDVPSS